jgi:hypothetical protein
MSSEITERLEASFRNDDLHPFINYLIGRLITLGEPIPNVMDDWHASRGRKQLSIELELGEKNERQHHAPRQELLAD